MKAKRTTPIVSWALGLLTIFVLVLNIPSRLGDMLGLWLLFVSLTALALNLGVLLKSGQISPAHVFAIMAFLTMGHNGQAAEAIWAVAVGALIGGLVQVARKDEWLPRRRVSVRSLGAIAETMAQLTLSLLVGATLYLHLGGRLPLGYMEPGDAPPLLILAVGFVSFYLLFFVLKVRLEGTPFSAVVREDWVALFGVVLLPVPFGILGAVVATDLDQLSWTILIGGVILVVFGVYGLSRTQYYYRQQVDELSSISVVSQALRTNLELNSLLETIYLQVAHLLNVDNFTVALLDPVPNLVSFPVVLRRGSRTELLPREMGDQLIDYVIKNRVPLLLERDVALRARAIGLQAPDQVVYSWLGVPLLASDRALGAIVVASGDPEHLLSVADQRLLMNIAAQAGIAIDNAQLYGQAQDRALQLGTLNSISALLTGTLSPEKVLNLVASSVVAVANCDAVAVYLYNGDRLVLERNIALTEAFSSNPPTPLIDRQMGDADPTKIGRQPVVVADSHNDPLVSPELRAFMDTEGQRAWLELMMVAGDHPLGVITAYYSQPRAFSGEEIELLRTFAVQAALAVHNARLYTSTDIALDRRVNQLQALYDIGQELTAILNLQKIFDLVLDRALEGTRSAAGVVVVGTDDKLGLQAVAYRGYPANVFANAVSLSTGITATVFDTGQMMMVENVDDSSTYRALNPDTRSQLSVPIRREAETLGVITVESPQVNAFGDDDITFISQIATQAAIAIDNARLFKRIAEGRDRLQVILDSMTEGVLLIDSDGEIALANPRIETLIGLRPARLVGRLVDDLLLDEDLAVASRMGYTAGEMRLLLADLRAGTWDADSAGQRSYELQEPGHVFIDLHIAPVQDDNGALLGLLMVFSDETEQQELSQARDDLSRMIVHDLRGPLTAVTASLKLLTDLIPEDSEYGPIVQRTTDASMRAVRKLLNLVDSLLDIAKMESGQMKLEREATHVNAIASNVVMDMDSLAREMGVNLAIDVPFSLPPLDVDSGQIERVLVNLVDNALKFTPSEGVVQIAAYPPGTNGADLNFVRVEVSDTGPGIPDEHKDRLFNRFVQVDGVSGRRRGTGLGLTFCRLAVEAHGGAIWIEDNPQGGAVFAFTLPVAQDAALEEDDELFTDDGLAGPLL